MASKDRYVDIEALIIEIEERPPIWNISLKEYSDKNIRKNLWEEITMKLGGDEIVESNEKKTFCLLLQKKWKNVRDCYFRELRRLKNVRSGAAAPKKTSYIYFERLSFLKTVAEHAPTFTNFENEDSGTSSFQETQDSQQYRPHHKKQRVTEDTIGMQMIDVLKSSISAREQREKNVDSDKLFLLSLLDDFKKIPNNLKASAKIDMIKLLEKYQNQNITSRQGFDYSNTQWSYDTSSRQGYFTGPPSATSNYSVQSPESRYSQNSEYIDTFE